MSLGFKIRTDSMYKSTSAHLCTSCKCCSEAHQEGFCGYCGWSELCSYKVCTRSLRYKMGPAQYRYSKVLVSGK